ncbi:hypothetical protein [Klebsiella pneumoniae IS46]|nr:hypothetical protein [Klebsiella pneumoniae IS46]
MSAVNLSSRLSDGKRGRNKFFARKVKIDVRTIQGIAIGSEN